MLYILGLFLILGLILGGFSGYLPFDLNKTNITGVIGGIIDDFKNKAYEFVFPPSENEILVDNLNSNYNLLDKFFSKSSDKILNLKDIPVEEKEALKQAVDAFNKTKSQIKILGAEVVKKEPGILESLIKKTLGLENIDNTNNPDPTHIPPSCRLECGE